MDFVTVRELRTDSTRVWDEISAGKEFVITRNGKPFAIMAPTLPAEVEENLRALRAARFGRLLAEQHKKSVALGLHRMTLEEINAEIAAARKERRESEAGSR